MQSSDEDFCRRFLSLYLAITSFLSIDDSSTFRSLRSLGKSAMVDFSDLYRAFYSLK